MSKGKTGWTAALLIALVAGAVLWMMPSAKAQYGGGAAKIRVGQTVQIEGKIDFTVLDARREPPVLEVTVVYPDRYPPHRFDPIVKLLPNGWEVQWEDYYGVTYLAFVGFPDGRGLCLLQYPLIYVEAFLGNLSRNHPWVPQAAPLGNEDFGLGFATVGDRQGFYAGRIIEAGEGLYYLAPPLVSFPGLGEVPYRPTQRLSILITDDIRRQLGCPEIGGETNYTVFFDEVQWSPPLASRLPALVALPLILKGG